MDAALGSHCHGADAGFIVIPTGKDHGTIALAFALYFWSKGMLVISAEKGTSAYHFDKIRAHLASFGGWATVGGGMMLIPSMQLRQLYGQPLLIHGVFNATINYILSGVQEGRSLITVCQEAQALGYAEPSENVDPRSIIRGEIQDNRLKGCAFHNQVLAGPDGPYLHPDQFDLSDIDDQDILDIADSNRVVRYVWTMTNTKKSRNGHGGRGSLSAKLGSWDFDARFTDINERSPLANFLPFGVDNCIKVQNVVTGNGPYRLLGPGAGKVPTVDALVSNFEYLYAQRQLAR